MISIHTHKTSLFMYPIITCITHPPSDRADSYMINGAYKNSNLLVVTLGSKIISINETLYLLRSCKQPSAYFKSCEATVVRTSCAHFL